MLAYTLGGFGDDPDLHVMLNMDGRRSPSSYRSCPGRRWHRAVDTSLASPNDIAEPGAEPAIADSTYRVNSHSVVVLLSR